MTQIRRRFTGANALQVESRPDPGVVWKPISHLVALGYESPFTSEWEIRHAIGYGGLPGGPVLPFQPLSVRFFDGDEQARTGNPLSLVPTASRIAVPARAQGLDYVPRLGFVIAAELADATPAEARAAISTFVLINEFTVRGEGEPFGTTSTSMAPIAVPAGDLLDSWQHLVAATSVNGQVVGQARAADSTVDIAELLAETSEGERLVPGELFSIDAFARAAEEPLGAGDHLVIAAPKLGRIEHHIG